MKGDTWNGRGMGSSDKGKFTREMMDINGLDFIGIQETLDNFREAWLEQIGAKYEFFLACQTI